MDQIEEIQSKVDIVQLISEYLTLQKAGRNFKALCPFHAEKTPSFVISPERQIFKCFGCNKGGNVFEFLMGIEGMEFGEALKTLAKRAGVQLTSYKPNKPEAEKERLWSLNHLASEFYHYLLLSHPIGKKALDYLLNRGIQRSSIKLFKLGYAPPLNNALIKFLVNKKGYRLDEIQKSGLSSSQGRDFLRDRVVFPLKDHRGNIVGFSGRFLGTWKAENAAQTGPKYINIPETTIYHKSDLLYGLEITKRSISSSNKAVIVEGEFDLISSYQAGVENVVAIKGSALTENHLKLLKRFCENIALSLDRDLAGDAAARRGVDLAEVYGFDIQVVRLPTGKDPDELARKDPEVWQQVSKNTISIYDFYLESVFSRFDPATTGGQRQISTELLPILAKISNEIIKDSYVRKLAKKLGVAERAVSEQMNKMSKKPFVSSPDKKSENEPQDAKPRREVLEGYLLSLAFQSDKPKFLLDKNVRSLVAAPFYKRIIDLLIQFFAKEASFDSKKFSQLLPSELMEIFNNLYLWETDHKLTEERWLEQEKNRVISQLGQVGTQQELQELTKKIAQLEKGGREKELQEAQENFSRLSKKLGRLAAG